ncbi:MAG: hypothetical protein RXR65_07800, partial [Hydrogenobaculum sp.]
MSKQLTLINNYQLLDLLGLIEPVEGGLVRLSNRAVVLKDDIPIEGLPNSKVFTLDKILKGDVFKKEELEAALDNLPYREYLRVFFAKFRPDQNGRITQKVDMWDSIKAWRYDIDLLTDEEIQKLSETLDEELHKMFREKIRKVLSFAYKLPLIPNIIKRSRKGLHLIYVFDKPITRDAIDTYLKRYNNPNKNKPDDDIVDQYIVLTLLSEYIPKYFLELDPTLELDIQASKVISSIATRFVGERAPDGYNYLAAGLYHQPYTFKQFRKAYEFLMLNDEEDVVYKQGKQLYTIHDIPKNTFLSLMDRCEVLKALDEDWENHSEYEWYVMTNYYAIRILYADTKEEAESLRKEFHEKSSRWVGNGNKRYTYNEAERQLQYYIRKQ